MRRILMYILCLMLLPTVALIGFAVDDTLTISDGAGQPGDVIFLTVTMNESVSGDSLGIQYTYDKDILKALPASSSWSKQGVLQDFGTKDVGVWAASSPTGLQGTICVLAFAIKEGAVFNQTEVTCEVIVRNGDKLVGNYTATAIVSHLCDHSFGQWQNHDDAEHSRICSSCEFTETQSHRWDEGNITEKPNAPMISLQTFTCEVCGANDVIEIVTPVNPTGPSAETNPPKENANPGQDTGETQPVSTPPTTPAPTAPAENNGQLEGFIENLIKKEEDGHDHSGETVMPESSETECALDHDHEQEHGGEESMPESSETECVLDHDHEQEHGGEVSMSESFETECVLDHVHAHDNAESSNTNIVVFVVFAVTSMLVLAGLWLVKKR